MAESIGVASWKAFLKKQKLALDDDALVKALTRYDKTELETPEPRAQALDDVLEQAKKQVAALAKKKKELGDKPFNEAKDKLYEVIDGAEKLLKEARAAQAASEEEEGDSPALLTTKMVPLIRALRKGDVTMHALIGTAGKNTAVLIMKRPVAPSRRKLIGEAIDAKGGAKYIPGECLFENQALTFVVKSQAAGLAKRVKAALLQQTELRVKVRVRGEDPNDVDEDVEEGETDEADTAAQPGVQARVPPAPPGGPASAEQLAYHQRLLKVRARLEAALAAQHPESTKLRGVSGYASEKAAAGDYAAASKALQMIEKLLDAPAATQSSAPASPASPASPTPPTAPTAPTRPTATAADAGATFKARMLVLLPQINAARAAGNPAAQDARSKLDQAGVLAGKRDFTQAGVLLDEAASLLERGQATATATATPGDAAAPQPVEAERPPARPAAGAARSVRPGTVAFAKVRLQWNAARAARESAIDRMMTVAAELLESEEYEDDPRTEAAQAAIRRLPDLVPDFDEKLGDLLDDLGNSDDDTRREQLRKKIRESISAYKAELDAQPLLTALQNTPLGFTPIRDSLVGALTELEKALP